MKGKLDRKQIMNVIIYASMGILIFLFIISIIVGNRGDQAEEENQGEITNETYEYSPAEDRNPDSSQISNNRLMPEDLNLAEDEVWESHDDVGELEPQEVDESKLPPSYEEQYGEEDVEKSKEVVEQFVELIFTVDGEEPMKHVEDSKEYMTERLYENLQEDFKHGQMAWTYGVKQEFESADIYEPATIRAPETDEIVWAVNVKGTVQYHEGEIREKTDIYLIHLIKIDDEFKVDDYVINVPT